MPDPHLPPGFDFTDPDIYAHRLPVEELAELRRAAPIWWNAQSPDEGGFGDGGFWVVSKHRDVREVSLRSDVFSSAAKSIVPRYQVTGGGGQIEAGRASMINMDDPEHTRLRKIIARGFTPRAVERLRAELGQRAQRIAVQAAEAASGDFVLQVARELPLQAIAGLLGVPLEDRDKLFDWTNKVIGDDIVTTLIDADADGQLTEAEFGMFVVTLTVAGNETTRNSITQAMMAFTTPPD